MIYFIKENLDLIKEVAELNRFTINDILDLGKSDQGVEF